MTTGAPSLRGAPTACPPFDLAGVVGAHLERNAVDLEWHAFLSDWDVLLTPTWAQPAFAHGADLVSLEQAMDMLAVVGRSSRRTCSGSPPPWSRAARPMACRSALSSPPTVR